MALDNPTVVFKLNMGLMLWRAKRTRDHVVGNSGQGMHWQGSGKTSAHGPGTWPRHMAGPRHMAPCRGGASRLYCKEDIVAGRHYLGPS